MYTFPTNIESAFEESDSLGKLEKYVQEVKYGGLISKSLIAHTEVFITTSFKDQLPVI